MSIKIKRIYDKPTADDGLRILVDRLWPRGVSKAEAQLDAWLKDVAPSPELRTWFNHEPEKFAEFSKKYTSELRDNPAAAELKSSLKTRLRHCFMAPKIQTSTMRLCCKNS